MKAPAPTPARVAAPPDVWPGPLLPGQILLVYTPDGPVGGTFTCTGCRAQAWQPDLLDHGAGCTFVTTHPAPGDAPVTPR